MKNGQLLNQCTANLRELFQRVDKIVPVEILPSTIRTLEQQKEFVRVGTSKKMDSMHLISIEHPFSRAVDAGPYPHVWPVEGTADFWKDWARLYYFAGVVWTVANTMGFRVRYGGDWDGNFNLKDQNFYDGVHFEEVI